MAVTNYQKLGRYTVQDDTAATRAALEQRLDDLAKAIEDVKAKGSTDMAIVMQSLLPMQRDAMETLMKSYNIEAASRQAVADNLTRLQGQGMQESAASILGKADTRALESVAPFLRDNADAAATNLSTMSGQIASAPVGDIGQMVQNAIGNEVGKSASNLVDNLGGMTDPTTKMDTASQGWSVVADSTMSRVNGLAGRLRASGDEARASAVEAAGAQVLANGKQALSQGGIQVDALGQRQAQQLTLANKWVSDSLRGAMGANFNVPDDLQAKLADMVMNGTKEGVKLFDEAKKSAPDPKYLVERYNEAKAQRDALVPGTDATSRAMEAFIGKVPGFEELQAAMGFTGQYARQEAATWLATHPNKLRDLVRMYKTTDFGSRLNSLEHEGAMTNEIGKAIGDDLRSVGIPTSDFGRTLGLWMKPRDSGLPDKNNLGVVAYGGLQSDDRALAEAVMDNDIEKRRGETPEKTFAWTPKPDTETKDPFADTEDPFAGMSAEAYPEDPSMFKISGQDGKWRGLVKKDDNGIRVLSAQGSQALSSMQDWPGEAGTREYDALDRLLAGVGKSLPTPAPPTDSAPASIMPAKKPVRPTAKTNEELGESVSAPSAWQYMNNPNLTDEQRARLKAALEEEDTAASSTSRRFNPRE